MYFTDSMVRRVFASFAEQGGIPDGLTVDAEGFVWSAVWDGWRIVRLAPDGRIDREVRVPVQRPTSCMFGGPDLRILYITSAAIGLDCEALVKGPLAGALFALECEVRGLPETPFSG